ncbi:post-GPI attachment to proteins factor 6 isoform X2 [Nerophis lumbriciformis]|uniref:post-GPI attachment to proteins factor 6 isoform X2 n=1 Tax=Nerophis lumbriciformis TaxID=546530 RepID=UPI002ADF8C5A|nr:transmembrane protein 8B-like isoform X2 [Nerophis lumbriciformis]
MGIYFPGCLLFFALSTSAFEDSGEVTFVSEFSSKPNQKLSKYGWYGNVRLQSFHIPEETAIARWLFTVTKDQRFYCRPSNVSIYIRHGAPPVINPIGTAFPNATLWSRLLVVNLSVTAAQNSATFNLSNPAPGDWFVAAHLPEDDGRIEQKGFPSCTYMFQPQLSIRRAVDTPILQQGQSLRQTATPDNPARLKLYVPQFASSVSVSLDECASKEGTGSANCSLVLSLGSNSLLEVPVRVNCSGRSCSASLTNPPWDTWLRVVVESVQDNQTAIFNVSSDYTVGCKPESVGLAADDDFINVGGNINSSVAANSSAGTESIRESPLSLRSACVRRIPVRQEETDILSLRFTPAHNGPNVSVTTTQPTLLMYPLPETATGGTLNLQLTLNTTNTTLGNGSNVVACLSLHTPVLKLNNSQPCRTALFGGYGLIVNVSSPKAMVRLSFPKATTWYLTLQLTCNSTDCENVSVASVVPEVFISACVDDCGTFGECRLLRSYTYLYASCSCTAGWKGWGCTDSSTALSFSFQLLATLLLTLSNFFFVPAIVVAIKRLYITEAAVYLFTAFFSTFYHACDQPGEAEWCIMRYDTLQYCDFLGSICSIWVTILCMARVRNTMKCTLFMLGALLIAMSLQLDRRGLWNLVAPILCALLFMVAVWTYQGVQRRHCYPPSWQRWVFYIIPGLLCAVVGVCLYIFAETEENYYYTHSLWHILVATCVVFLLPPADKNLEAGGWSKGWRPHWNWDWSWVRTTQVCGHTLWPSSKAEFYTVS